MAALLLLAAVPDAIAQSRAVQRGAKALSELKRGGMVGELDHRIVRTELGRRRVLSARLKQRRGAAKEMTAAERVVAVERGTLAALEMAPRNPAGARRVLETTRAFAAAHDLVVSPEAHAAVVAAVGRRRGRGPVDEGARAAPTRAPTRPHAELVAWARDYGAAMRRYNGSRPYDIIDKKASRGTLAFSPTGRVPYWDVSPWRGDTRVLGLAEQSPFRTPDGKVRIFSHYADAVRRSDLVKRLGPPTGTMEAELTSSYRTLLVYPEGEAPYMLKFSGEFNPDSWGRKTLTPAQVELSVERSLQLTDNPDLVPEPAGLIVDGRKGSAATTVIYRPLPFPRSGRVRPGSRLLTAHVLNDFFFEGSRIGEAIFGRHGSPEAWFARELAPALAGVLHRSITRSFVHLELHSQNVDVVIGPDGAVDAVLVKDLLDMMHDPAVEAAGGDAPRATTIVRDGSWGDMGEPDARSDTERFHSDFLGQLSYPADERDGAFHGTVVRELVALARKDLASPALRSYPEYQELVIAEKPPKLPRAIALVRDLTIKTRLETRFRPDASARAEIETTSGRAVATTPDGTPAGLELGRVNDVPVAVKRAPNGAIQQYYFRFD